MVQAGDVLLRLDGREARANLTVARAALAEARAVRDDAVRQLDRVQQLGDGASAAQLDAAQVGLARAEAAVGRAEGQKSLASVAVERMTLVAPFAGEVVHTVPDVGDLLGPGSPGVRVADVSSRKVQVGLVADELSAANEPSATWTAHTSTGSWPLTVERVSRAADPRTGTWTAELRLQADTAPAAGSSVDVVLGIPLKIGTQGAAVVPAAAVRDSTLVRVVVDNRVQVREVTVLGEVSGGIVVSGVADGESVVVHASDPVQDGDTVVVLQAVEIAP